MNCFGIEVTFRFTHLSAVIAVSICAFTFLTAFYAAAFFKNKKSLLIFYGYLFISLVFSLGAVFADNLVIMLFFWEGLLLVLFGMISQSGGVNAYRSAIKAFVIVGISDLCMMVGIALTGYLAQTLNMSGISLVPQGLGAAAFMLLVIGAIAKAGSMPFHTWIPDAATDAPLPFMAYFPAALEKLLGIYFLSRICLDLFTLEAGSGLSIVLMTIGAVTILLAVMMALVQKDFKKLLSYHAISQVGYMVLGIGTALPVGILGGLFHMLNNALYKSCLFFTAGAVEKQAGTTDLQKLGGLFRKMPVTAVSFLVAAVSISGVPPFNGFFSKELVYDAALQGGKVFYLAAVIGSFFTAASFLKLGHAVFFGRLEEPNRDVKEAPIAMRLVMLGIALCCILFGAGNAFVIRKLFEPVLTHHAQGFHGAGFQGNITLIVITIVVLLGAVIHHFIGVKMNGSGLKAVDHIHYSVVFRRIYQWQEKKYFDPYEMGMRAVAFASGVLWRCDRMIDWVYNSFITGVTYAVSRKIRKAHSGYYVIYVIWSLVGAFLVMLWVR